MEPLNYHTPGQLLAKLLEDRGWSQRVLAIVLEISEAAVSKILSGSMVVTAEMALKLESLFGVQAEVFVKLQRDFDLAKARLTAQPDTTRATRAALFGDLPVPDMIRRGWLKATNIRDIREVEGSLMRFFGVESLGEIEILPHAAKKTVVAVDANPAQLAWLYRLRQLANDLMVGTYSEFGVRAAVKKLEPLMMSAASSRKVPYILAECGIRFVIVETIGNAKIDGACMWLDGDSPVIGMSLRYDRIDNFWFVLRHELEHVIRLHGRNAAIRLDAELEGAQAGTGLTLAQEEREANEAAMNFVLTPDKLDQFIKRKAPFYRDADLLGFAKTVGVHPGIVAGRLQRELERYDLFRQHLVKIRPNVTASAMVDGWGEIALVE